MPGDMPVSPPSNSEGLFSCLELKNNRNKLETDPGKPDLAEYPAWPSAQAVLHTGISAVFSIPC